ncbi:hypothetical protein LTR56_009616 [Elasticomyces elasticus]|nr:hypothetical protein LTR56_009616 [Elasticomyces elasticus]KAK3660116.1 hypothetical protein LTR22_008123 [Elasticomyces elasticus]KAK4923421.1 hypothetical protein LTR49_009295 [Elasticomyces elasticus]KAK5752292.1 hypothetical protein LTS12_017593 [Elasticomyces elasticus]
MSWLSKLQRRPSNHADTPTQARVNRNRTGHDDNRILFQTFEWHTESQPPAPHEKHCPSSHYARLTRLLPSLASAGITAIWLPPGCKANSPQGNGYDCYDLWDLGEFDQKWTRSTKWGSREELAQLIGKCKELELEVVWDSVLNHKTAGDGTEEAWAVEVDGEDRRVEICSPKKIEAWLRYDFPGRKNEGMKYSSFKWRAEHFNGIDWDQRAQKNAIYKLVDDPATYPKPLQQQDNGSGGSAMNRFTRLAGKLKPAPPARRPGKGWAEDVDDMHGNYDYLMFANVDYTHPEVRKDTLNWGDWMIQSTGVNGFRLDAVQHFSYNFTREWISRVNATNRQKCGKDAFVVGEIWTGEVERITKWLDVVGQGAYAYDSPLLYNFSRISEDVRTGSVNADLRTILRNSLLGCRPEASVTLVANHDTQPGQASFTPMLAELKTLWYAFILLRSDGYPCVFWGDVYGTKGPKAERPACTVDHGRGEKRSLIPDLMMVRTMFAFGEQRDYWDAMSCIAWTRDGKDVNGGCIVLLSIGPAQDKKGVPGWTVKKVPYGRPGEVYVDVLANAGERAEVKIDENGEGLFSCKGMSASVFVRKDAPGIESFPVRLNLDAYGQ